MNTKSVCVFNEDAKNKMFNLYRSSNLEVLEYIVEITKTWDNRAQEFLDNYRKESSNKDKQETIFWDAMNYYGLASYLYLRECLL